MCGHLLLPIMASYVANLIFFSLADPHNGVATVSGPMLRVPGTLGEHARCSYCIRSGIRTLVASANVFDITRAGIGSWQSTLL